MIAKVIVYGTTRQDAIDKMRKALEDFRIEGIQTNMLLMWNILSGYVFQHGQMDTNYLEDHLQEYIS